MARIDLNIVDRGIQGSTWIAEDVGLTAEHLDKVLEQKTDNSGALNSLPTPFARFFVAREAFRRAQEEHVNKKNEAGFAYRQLVSDILDVYELLFNRKYHENTWVGKEKKIELREWKSKENLKYIKEKMPILYNSIDNYYKSDIKEENLYFLVYITANKNTIPNEPLSPFITSGLRIGTPAVTTRGLNEADMDVIADCIATAVHNFEGNEDAIRAKVTALLKAYPLYE